MTNAETIKALDAEIMRQEAELQRLREEKAAIVQEENQVDQIFDAVLNCPHSITHESVTLHFYPRQKEGHNALAHLHHRLAAYDQEARQRELQLLSEIEALERLALVGVAPNALLYDPREVAFSAQPAAQGLDAETRRHAAIGKAIELACRDLPDGTEISVSLEKGAGTVTLIDQDGNEHENFSTDYGFAGVLNEAIDAAIAAQAKKGEQ